MSVTIYVSKASPACGKADTFATVTEALSAIEAADRAAIKAPDSAATAADHHTVIEAAHGAVPAADRAGLCPITIRISPGIYHEKIEIRRSCLTLIGEGASPCDVVLSYDDFAFDAMPDGTKRGTFRSYSVLIDASDVAVKNLTIENCSGDEHIHGQAIALYAEGDRLSFEQVRLLGRQDTLFTGPLPPKELMPGGFVGPKQFAPRINGRQYYKDCYICGNIDFIFGSATAVFSGCTIESLSHSDRAGDIQGYVCAPSTPEGQTYGYLFLGCRFVSGQCPPASCYLARPWREYAKAVFADCTVGPHIHPDGFHDWNKPAFHSAGLFSAYNVFRSAQPDDPRDTLPADGPDDTLPALPADELGASHCRFRPQASFAVSLTQEQAAFYTDIKEIFS